MSLTMDKISFGQWLQKEREKRGLSQSDLARLSGLHRQIINKTENGVSTPAVGTFIALSNALKISPVFLFRHAGLLPLGPVDELRFDDWKYLLAQMSPEDQEELRQIAELKIKKRQKDTSLKSLETKKAN